MRYVRLLAKRLEHHFMDDGTPYYYDPEADTSTYTFPTVLYYWGVMRKLGVVTGNGTVTGGGIELAGKSRRPDPYADFGGYITNEDGTMEVGAEHEHWELVDGNPPYYYNLYTGESTFTR